MRPSCPAEKATLKFGREYLLLRSVGGTVDAMLLRVSTSIAVSIHGGALTEECSRNMQALPKLGASQSRLSPLPFG
eukprot:5574818-Prymnesium_polylepis.1